MAETTDRPAGPANPPTAITAAPPAPPEVMYRPLSLLALGVFLLAVLYTAGLAIAAVVALWTRTPLLLPLWTLIFPLGIVVLALVARSHIKGSEGTLSGAAFTSWSLGLALVVGLTYAAYYGGTYVAIQQQASTVTDRFFQALQQGQMEKAYRIGIPPAGRPPDEPPVPDPLTLAVVSWSAAAQSPCGPCLAAGAVPYVLDVAGGLAATPEPDDLRAALEVAFNAQRDNVIPWADFQRSALARFIRNGPAKVQIQPLGLSEWDHDANSYKVVLRYRLQNEEESAEFRIAARGWDATPTDASGRRQWSIDTTDSKSLGETQKWTAEGERRQQFWRPAYELADKFARVFSQPNLIGAWHLTLPPAERAEALRTTPQVRLLEAPALAGAAALGAGDDRREALARSLHSFYEGRLIHAYPRTFYAPRRLRPEILRAVRGLFSSGADQRFGKITLVKYLPTWEEAEGRVRVGVAMQIEIANSDIARGTEWLVDGAIVVEAPAPAPGQTAADFHVVSLDLTAGRRAPEEAAPAGPRRSMRGTR
jgi:hypothetical protein